MRPQVDSEFFKRWSSDMAYVLGVIATDGCLVEYKNGYNGLNITSKDLEFLKKIKLTMSAEHKISKKSRGFQLHIRNRFIYSDLLKLGITPRKSKVLRFPIVPIRYLPEFIRGCFDGDGGVTIWREPRWRHTWQIRVTFVSGSEAFLRKLHERLLLYGKLRKGKIWYTGRAYELHFGIEDSLIFYKFIYSNDSDLFLKRKKDKFEKFIHLTISR